MFADSSMMHRATWRFALLGPVLGSVAYLVVAGGLSLFLDVGTPASQDATVWVAVGAGYLTLCVLNIFAFRSGARRLVRAAGQQAAAEER